MEISIKYYVVYFTYIWLYVKPWFPVTKSHYQFVKSIQCDIVI